MAVTLSKSLALHAMERYKKALKQFDGALELRFGFALARWPKIGHFCLNLAPPPISMTAIAR